jgi:hypothetical protein
MPDLASIMEWLVWLTIAGYVVLYLRFRREGLDRIYRVFAAFLLFRAVRSGLLALLPPIWYAVRNRPHAHFANNVYAWGWTLTEPVLWLFHVLVVLELYSLVFQKYKGVASMSRWAVFAGLGVAAALSSLTLPAELTHSLHQSPILRCFIAVGRGVDASLVIFLLFITAFLAWFPVPLHRNVVVYSLVYALYFLTGALADLAGTLRGTAVWEPMSLALVGVDLLCLVLWIGFLNRAGESKTVVVRHAWAPRHADVLIEQLAAINSSLMPSGRR